jgi:hypothetical protein
LALKPGELSYSFTYALAVVIADATTGATVAHSSTPNGTRVSLISLRSDPGA